MALDRLDALESRVGDLVALVQDLKRRNAALEEELRRARQRLVGRSDDSRRWERERQEIRNRIEKVLGQIEVLECVEESKEVALG